MKAQRDHRRFGFGMANGEDWCRLCDGPSYYVGGACVTCFARILVPLIQRHPPLFKALNREMGKRRRDRQPAAMRGRARELRERGWNQ